MNKQFPDLYELSRLIREEFKTVNSSSKETNKPSGLMTKNSSGR